MYTIYGIKDPKTDKFVYVGQTDNFDKRKKAHLRCGKKPRPKIGTQNIKTWLYDTLMKDVSPEFIILALESNEVEALRLETEWIDRLSKEGHLLLNRWREHRKIIKLHSNIKLIENN